jgi:hypothetical protein
MQRRPDPERKVLNARRGETPARETRWLQNGLARARGRLQFHPQVLDGLPGITFRRPSTFLLLIPVGYHRQGFSFVAR